MDVLKNNMKSHSDKKKSIRENVAKYTFLGICVHAD